MFERRVNGDALTVPESVRWGGMEAIFMAYFGPLIIVVCVSGQ